MAHRDAFGNKRQASEQGRCIFPVVQFPVNVSGGGEPSPEMAGANDRRCALCHEQIEFDSCKNHTIETKAVFPTPGPALIMTDSNECTCSDIASTFCALMRKHAEMQCDSSHRRQKCAIKIFVNVRSTEDQPWSMPPLRTRIATPDKISFEGNSEAKLWRRFSVALVRVFKHVTAVTDCPRTAPEIRAPFETRRCLTLNHVVMG